MGWRVVFVGGFLERGRSESADGRVGVDSFKFLGGNGYAIRWNECGGGWGKYGVRGKADACILEMKPGAGEGELLDKLLQGDRSFEDDGGAFRQEGSALQNFLVANKGSCLFAQGLVCFGVENTLNGRFRDTRAG